MKNSDIKYKTSTDYDRLYHLLKAGNLVIGFIVIRINGSIRMDYSKLIKMKYYPEYGTFDLGFTFFEQDFKKIDFSELCKGEDIRFIDL